MTHAPDDLHDEAWFSENMREHLDALQQMEFEVER
jgi:hypothetical protein